MFSEKVYNKHYGRIFVLISRITLVLFIYLISIVLRSVLDIPLLIEFGDFAIIIGILCMVGFVGFPAVLSINKGMKNLYKKSELKLKDNNINYIYTSEYMWTVAGHSHEKRIYNIKKEDISSYNITNRWIEIFGDFEYEIYNNGRKLDIKKTNKVKIGRAFDTDEDIIDYLNK